MQIKGKLQRIEFSYHTKIFVNKFSGVQLKINFKYSQLFNLQIFQILFNFFFC